WMPLVRQLVGRDQQLAHAFVSRLIQFQMYGKDWELFHTDSKRVAQWLVPAIPTLQSVEIRQATQLPDPNLVAQICRGNKLHHLVLTLKQGLPVSVQKQVQTDRYLDAVSLLGKQLDVLMLSMPSSDEKKTSLALSNLLKAKRG